MQNHAISLDQKEIRGINAKHVVWLIGVLSTILVAVMGTYYSTANKIEKTQDKVEQTQAEIQDIKSSKEVQDAQIKALNLNMQILEIKIARIETQLGIQNNTR
jgi:Tfp pilus assembly protein PilO